MAKNNIPCSEENCQHPVMARGLCNNHYHTQRRKGLALLPKKSAWDTLDKSQNNDGCWLWTRSKTGGGYGVTTYKGKTTSSHRVSWEETYGPVPEGLFVLHRCDNPPCCNPAHLFLGTHLDNMRDKTLKNRNNAARGEKSGKSILTDDNVTQMRRLRNQGYTLKMLGDRFKISMSTVSIVCRGHTWRHVPMDDF